MNTNATRKRKDRTIEYENDIRGYSIIIPFYYDSNKDPSVLQPIFYCPWCGTELPKELDEEWGEALEKEYNLTTDDFWDEDGNWDESKIPEEFRTDEWWKKRGM